MIKLEDLKAWRANRIQNGDCNFEDMEALGCFIDKADKYEVTEDAKTVFICNS